MGCGPQRHQVPDRDQRECVVLVPDPDRRDLEPALRPRDRAAPGHAVRRVAARDTGNVLGDYAARDFTKAWGASPTPTSPPLTDPSDPDGVVSLEFPTDPLLFTWNGLPGAQSYQLQVDDADDFIGATTYTTKNTA